MIRVRSNQEAFTYLITKDFFYKSFYGIFCPIKWITFFQKTRHFVPEVVSTVMSGVLFTCFPTVDYVTLSLYNLLHCWPSRWGHRHMFLTISCNREWYSLVLHPSPSSLINFCLFTWVGSPWQTDDWKEGKDNLVMAGFKLTTSWASV